ncbi:DUF397 domain-containing protein [Streptomyces sp. TR06-5]|uniref:DUF397 domain-containing protein n=1 Tax=Streptomyces sp. TR06-5 TaxID=3385976 RepID=UPI00399FE8C1
MSTEYASYRTDRLTWYKSSYSGTSGGDCVEVATVSATVHIRDSKDPSRGCLSVAQASWSTFIRQHSDTA